MTHVLIGNEDFSLLWRKSSSSSTFNLTSDFLRGSFYYINHCTFSFYIYIYLYSHVAQFFYSVRSCDEDHRVFLLHFTISFLKKEITFLFPFLLFISLKISCDQLTVNYFLFVLIFLIAKHPMKRAWHRDPSKCQIGSL